MKQVTAKIVRRAAALDKSPLNARSAVAVVKARTKALPARSAGGEANFDHWWSDEDHRALALAGESLTSAKVAMTYEGARRRPEVIAAVLAQLIPQGWQQFTGYVVAWHSANWSQLFSDQQARLIDEFYQPLYLPPLGMSTFPQRDARLAERMAVIEFGPESECCPGELAAAGFRVFAVDCKSRAAITAACKRIMRAGKTVRAADVRREMAAVERDIPRGVAFRVEGKITTPFQRFNFYRVAGELAAHDRRNQPSEFMQLIRL